MYGTAAAAVGGGRGGAEGGKEEGKKEEEEGKKEEEEGKKEEEEGKKEEEEGRRRRRRRRGEGYVSRLTMKAERLRCCGDKEHRRPAASLLLQPQCTAHSSVEQGTAGMIHFHIHTYINHICLI